MSQKPTDLALTLTQTPIHARIYADRHLHISGWDVRFAIIGESHFVHLCRDDTSLYEVLACMPGTENTARYHHPLRDGTAHHLNRPGYTVRVWFSHHPGPLPPTDDDLVYAFPAATPITPETRVGWRVQARSMQWWTLHIYPQRHQTTYVYSRSTFDFFNEKRDNSWKV